jgi:hypothetical protein
VTAMPSVSPSLRPSVETIELMRASVETKSRDDDQEKQTYSAVITIVIDNEQERAPTYAYEAFFCDFVLNREGHDARNFAMSATYYVSITSEDPKYRLTGDYAQNIAKTLVWSRFFEFARYSLSQAGITDVDIPIEPRNVSVKTMRM